jgi:hypothetical protein
MVKIGKNFLTEEGGVLEVKIAQQMVSEQKP